MIAHNTVLTNGNSRFSLETRWAAVEFRNNLTDAPYRGRDGGTFVESENVASAVPEMFVNPSALDLRLLDTPLTRLLVIDRAVAGYAATDWTGAARPVGDGPDVGAAEFSAAPLPPPTFPPPPASPPPPAPAPCPAAPQPVMVGGAPDGSVRSVGMDGSVSSLSPFGNTGTATRTATADVDADGVADLVAVTGPGTPLRVAVLSGADGSVLVAPFDPFGGNFLGGGYVAAADLDRDGRAEFVVTPDQGGGPRVTVFGRGADGTTTVRANFLGIDDASFRGGARAALGDVNADGTPDVVVAAGFGGGPRTAVFAGQSVLAGSPARLVADFFAFPGSDALNLRNGSFVAVGDVTGDGYADLVFGGGPGGAPRVFILSGALVSAGDVAGAQAAPVANFFAGGDLSDRGGARVGVTRADADGRADVVVGSGAGRPAGVRVYLGKDFASGEPAVQLLDPLGGAVLADGVYVG
ncbi:VCBS repeat-containing protein [bacterium]|nr:VCBS repeat-containing protein [bacterium]